MGSSHTTFVGSQDGRAYALDADLGAHVGGALWYTSPLLGNEAQAGVAAMFTMFGGVGNRAFAGVRNGALPAQFFALDPTTGKPGTGSPFSGGGFPIGSINTTASVDYNLDQVYVASQQFTVGDPSLWCIRLNATGFGPPCWSQILPWSITGGPVERNGTVYVGDDLGQVWAFNAAGGTLKWGPFASCGGSPIKSFVLADRLGTAENLYYATTSTTVPALCSVRDNAGTPSVNWAIPLAMIPGPSAPILARIGLDTFVYVGGSDGRLYQVNVADPFASGGIKSVLVRPGAIVGAPAYDGTQAMIYVGTDAGAVYAVQAPLP
jgi:outer membrane protein assembly factor BamB